LETEEKKGESHRASDDDEFISFSFFSLSLPRTCLALLPNTKSSASMTLDLPEPLGPTTEEND